VATQDENPLINLDELPFEDELPETEKVPARV